MRVEIEKNGPVWTVIHNRPQARNAVDPESGDALVAAFTAFDADPEARVAVFWGAGGAFCAGWDLKYASTLQDPERYQKEIIEGLGFPLGAAPAPRGPLGPSRLEMTKPVIAAVEGPAVAGGMELALWCDVRVMAETAYIGVYCRRWGVPLVDGGTVRLPRLVGTGQSPWRSPLPVARWKPMSAIELGFAKRWCRMARRAPRPRPWPRRLPGFPRKRFRVDRRSIIENHGRPTREALQREWANGIHAVVKEGAAGAGRFRDGLGRHGDHERI